MIAIGSDHRGFECKEHIKIILHSLHWVDVGTYTHEMCDYPIFAKTVSNLILDGKVQQGILLCATGTGMVIAANRYAKIYAAVAWNKESAIKAKEDDNINVLVLPTDYLTHHNAIEIIKCWQNTSFKGGNYAARLALIDNIPDQK